MSTWQRTATAVIGSIIFWGFTVVFRCLLQSAATMISKQKLHVELLWFIYSVHACGPKITHFKKKDTGNIKSEAHGPDFGHAGFTETRHPLPQRASAWQKPGSSGFLQKMKQLKRDGARGPREWWRWQRSCDYWHCHKRDPLGIAGFMSSSALDNSVSSWRPFSSLRYLDGSLFSMPAIADVTNCNLSDHMSHVNYESLHFRMASG